LHLIAQAGHFWVLRVCLPGFDFNPMKNVPRGLVLVRVYVAVIERGSDGLGVFFPDVPGCTSAGATVQEAATNAEAALYGHLSLALEHGEALPDATALDDVPHDPEVDEVARVLVRFSLI
jgi:predicted RNase H-like HicB family nuclease